MPQSPAAEHEPPAVQGSIRHHHLPLSELLVMLGADDRRGLGSAEAEARLAQFGPNVLPHVPGPVRIARFLSQFNHPLIYVLLGAAPVTGLLGETVDAGVILGVVLVNAVVGFIQESRAAAALATLAQLTRTTARMIRDRVALTAAPSNAVPGDLVVLEAGDSLPQPADPHLVETHRTRPRSGARPVRRPGRTHLRRLPSRQ